MEVTTRSRDSTLCGREACTTFRVAKPDLEWLRLLQNQELRMKTFLAAGIFTAVLLGPAQAGQEFGGYECTDGCVSHVAGYIWAQQHHITSESACRGKSNSFVEGCRVYVGDPNHTVDEDDDGDPISR
jgi:hypothetical protein